MAIRRVMLLCALAACLVLPACPAAAAPPKAPDEQKMVEALNAVRAKRHLPHLRRSRSLERSSFAFAWWLMRANVFGHARSIQASHRFRRLGEVLAWRAGWRLRRRATVRMWLSSPSHRAVILSRAYRYAGAGRARGLFGGGLATMWVVQLGGR